MNAYICWRLFRLEYSQYMGSIEAAYIGISHHILASGGDLSWWPAWYMGIPFQNAYPPLLHFLVAGAAAGPLLYLTYTGGDPGQRLMFTHLYWYALPLPAAGVMRRWSRT